MKGTGLEDRLKEKLPQDLEKPISPDTWNQVDPDLKYSLVLLRACHSNCQWIMLEETGLRSLTDITRQYFLRRLSDRIMVIVHHKDITAVGKYNENIVSLIDGTGIIALGNIDWFQENHARVEEIINKNYNRAYTCVDNEDDIDMDKI
jgi:mannosyltransferase OCH1-like enzyme